MRYMLHLKLLKTIKIKFFFQFSIDTLIIINDRKSKLIWYWWWAERILLKFFDSGEIFLCWNIKKTMKTMKWVRKRLVFNLFAWNHINWKPILWCSQYLSENAYNKLLLNTINRIPIVFVVLGPSDWFGHVHTKKEVMNIRTHQKANKLFV